MGVDLECLDLSRHRPHEFEGKSLRIEGCDYVVGTLFRENSQGHSHHLRNERSGLSLHVMQVRRSYLDQPDVALAASQQKAVLTAQLRAGLLSKGEPAIASSLRVIDIGTGALELHEFPAPMDAISGSTFERTNRHVAESNFAAAIHCIEALLEQMPLHTEALAFLAACHAFSGDFRSATSALAAALAIEPNLTSYWVQQLECQVRAQMPAAAASTLEEFQRRFPLEHDCDYWGVHALLQSGETEAAAALLGCAALSAATKGQLADLVMAARAAATVVANAREAGRAGQQPLVTRSAAEHAGDMERPGLSSVTEVKVTQAQHAPQGPKASDPSTDGARPWWKRWLGR